MTSVDRRPPSIDTSSSPNANVGQTNDPKTPTRTQHAAQQAMQPTTLGLAASQSLEPREVNATVKPVHGNRRFEFTTNFTWQGEKYRYKLVRYSDKDRTKMRKAEVELFEKEGKELIELMVVKIKADLDDQLKNKDSSEPKIHPGDNCRVIIKDGKFILVHEDDADEIESIDDPKPDTLKGKRAVIANDEASKALAEAACADTGQKTWKALQSPALKPLRETAKKETAEKAKGAAPVRLVNKRNACFINASFQELVNDPNPAVIAALQDPKNFIGGEFNPLFQAIKAYREHQQLGKPLNVAEILEMPIDQQQDAVLDARKWFELHFDWDHINHQSPLYDLFDDTPTVITSGNSLDELASKKVDADAVATADKLPDQISLYTPRITLTDPGQPLSHGDRGIDKPAFVKAVIAAQKKLVSAEELQLLKDTLGENFDTDLGEFDYSVYLNYHASEAAQNSPRKAEVLTALLNFYRQTTLQTVLDFNHDQEGEQITAANTILDDPVLLDCALAILDPDDKLAVNKAQAQRINPTKNTEVLEVNDDATVTISATDGSTKTYDLTSIIVHQGRGPNRGHYVHLVRKGPDVWKSSDSSVTPSNMKEFLKAARSSACAFTLHRQGLVPTKADPAKAPGGGEKAKQANPNEVIQTDRLIQTSPSTLVVEEGSLGDAVGDKDKFTLVHPTNDNITEFNERFNKEVWTSEKDRDDIGIAIFAARRTPGKYWGENVNTFTPRVKRWGVPDSAPKMLQTSAVAPTIHLPLERTELTLDEVRQATRDVLTYALHKGITRLAFPVFNHPQNISDDQVVNAMKDEIRRFAQNNLTKWNISVKIVRPKPSVAPTATRTADQEQTAQA